MPALLFLFLLLLAPPPAAAEPCGSEQGELRALRLQASALHRQLVILRDASAALKRRTEAIDPDGSPTLWDLAEEVERAGERSRHIHRLIRERERELADLGRRIETLKAGGC